MKINKCLEALENYFKPSKNVVYEWYIFNTCVQLSRESVQSYITRLRKLAASCEYSKLMDDFIRDRLVIRLNDNGDKVRLLREKKLDLKRAIQMCTLKSHPNKRRKFKAWQKKFSEKKKTESRCCPKKKRENR